MRVFGSIILFLSLFNILKESKACKGIIHHAENFVQPKSSQMCSLLQDKKFWVKFSDEVLNKKMWKCSFSENILNENLEEDAKMYKDPTIFLKRRHGIKKWLKNDTLWAETVYGASKELAYCISGPFTQELQKYHLLDALRDYIEHIHYFHEVADIMEARGEKVFVYSQNSSVTHDIDKLDPIMLVGYSERFEDNKTTSLWDKCVHRHTHINPHHQAYCLWHNCCKLEMEQCREKGASALKEMLCDKVSRRLQKTLNGKISPAMWDVDVEYYKGLPKPWLQRIEKLALKMKNWER